MQSNDHTIATTYLLTYCRSSLFHRTSLYTMFRITLLTLFTLSLVVARASNAVERDSNIACPTGKPFYITAESFNEKLYAAVGKGPPGAAKRDAIRFFARYMFKYNTVRLWLRKLIYCSLQYLYLLCRYFIHAN